MASILDEIQIKYKGHTTEYTSQQIRHTVIYQGSRELCEQAQRELKIGYVDSEFGTVESTRCACDEGPFWNLEVVYTIATNAGNSQLDGDQIGGGNNGNTGTGSGNQPDESSLSVTMMSMPLESHIRYRKNWNHSLYSTVRNIWQQTGDSPTSGVFLPVNILPNKVYTAWVNEKSNTNLLSYYGFEYTGQTEENPDGFGFYAWAKNISELPALPDGWNWYLRVPMQKPGVETWDFEAYQINESGKHSSKSKAGWALTQKANSITFPENGDFGIQKRYGGNWKCDGGSISWNGKYWLAQRTYTYSPTGWDNDLYGDF